MWRTARRGAGTPVDRATSGPGPGSVVRSTPEIGGPRGLRLVLGSVALGLVVAAGVVLDLLVGWPGNLAAGVVLAPLALSVTVVAARPWPASLHDRRPTPGTSDPPHHHLADSRFRIVVTADEARRRIERDLHDGAQQHLVLLAVKARLVSELIDTDPRGAKALADELRTEAQVALAELRELARGIYPAVLRERGLAEAVRAAALRVPLPTLVDCDGLGRFDRHIEAAVYFCCIEALQNAGRHAGSRATVRIGLGRDATRVRFEVRDDGVGFAPASVPLGRGLVNMHDRVRALGGSLDIDTAPDRGTLVRGVVPLR